MANPKTVVGQRSQRLRSCLFCPQALGCGCRIGCRVFRIRGSSSRLPQRRRWIDTPPPQRSSNSSRLLVELHLKCVTDRPRACLRGSPPSLAKTEDNYTVITANKGFLCVRCCAGQFLYILFNSFRNSVR